jgi:peptide/nickel transport system substrate-binding protein
MQMRHRYLPAVAAVVLVTAGCGQDAGDGSGTPDLDTAESVTIAISSDEGTLTPFTNQTGYPGANMVRLIYDTLVGLDPDLTATPLLATEVGTEDNQTYTLPIRSGVTWHDGTELTADDVVFSIEYYQARPVGDSAVDVSAVEGVSAEGDTVTITLDAPDPEFARRVLADMPIIPRHLWEDVEDPTTAGEELAVGSGPYRLETYDKDQGYTLVANENYQMGEHKVGTVKIVVIPEETTQFAAVRTGEIDASVRIVPPQQIEQLEQQDQVGLITGTDFASTLMLFNTTRAPFDRAEVRAALAKAIDTEDLVNTVLLGQGQPGNPGFIHPEAPVQADQLAPVFDPDAAAQELDALGATMGPDGVRELDGEPMSYELLVYNTSPDRVRSAELIVEMMDAVGVEVAVRPMDPDALDAKVWPEFDVTQGRDYDMSLWGWSAPVMLNTGLIAQLLHSDPDEGRLNVVGFGDPAVDSAIDALTSEPEMSGRTTAARELQRLIAEQLPFLTLYYRNGVYAYRSDVYTGWEWLNGRGFLHPGSFVTRNFG